MQGNRGQSSSEQYIKNSNRKLLFGGIIFIFVFLIALMLTSKKEQVVEEQQPLSYTNESLTSLDKTTSTSELSTYGTAELKVEPSQISMDSVVIGSKAEAILTLTAQNTSINYIGAEFAQQQADGFTIETTCDPTVPMAAGQKCIIKVLWNPVALQQLQNTLTITWKETSASSLSTKTTPILVKGQSTDSKDCVICEDIRKQEAAEPRMAMGLDGKLYPIDEDGYITINGKRVKEVNGIFIDEDGNIVGIATPEYIALNMNNEIMGTINNVNEVINANGETLGKVLGDKTIVDSKLTVLGAGVPVLSVMDTTGKVFGKMTKDGTVIDATNAVIGKVRVDQQVVNSDGKLIGYVRPWGLIADFSGKVIGGIIPDGTIINAKNETIATVTQAGFAINQQGELIGATIPQGVAVGVGCQSIGRVLLNGDVQDAYEQVIAKALIDGTVVNTSNEEIGSVISQGVVINEKGTVVGFVNSEGKAVSGKGKVIGCINPDGSISTGKKLIGAVLLKGHAIGYGCATIGTVFPTGEVFNIDMKSVGKVMPDGFVKDADNKIIGIVVTRAAAVANGCRLLGLVNIDGKVNDLTNQFVGCMTPEKTIVNQKNEVIGAVAKKGVVYKNDGSVLGRIRFDGKVMDLTGKIIGCINADGSITSLSGELLSSGQETGGTVTDENGNPRGWTRIGNDIYDASGNKIGTVNANNVIVDLDGKYIGFIPPDGVIFSPDGLILGRYSSKIGYAVNQSGERFDKVLPNLTVVSGETGEIVGGLIADKSGFIDSTGKFLGRMKVDGTLKNADDTLVGAIRGDGTVIDKEGNIIAFKVPEGRVVSLTGKEVGIAISNGDVFSRSGTKIGLVLGNGIVISSNGKILGGVLPRMALAMDVNGLVGYMAPDGKITGQRGEYIGNTTPFGIVATTDGGVVAKLVPFAVYMDNQNQVVGWMSFDGSLKNKVNRPIGVVSPNGLAFDKSNKLLGAMIPTGIVIDTKGSFVSVMAVNNKLLQKDKFLGSSTPAGYIQSMDDKIIGRVLRIGIGISNENGFLGWTRTDGSIGTQKESVGTVLFDNRIVNGKGTIIGTYIPFDAAAFDNDGRTVGLIGKDGNIVTLNDQPKGKIRGTDLVVQDDVVIGRLLSDIPFVSNNLLGKTSGMAQLNGETISINTHKNIGNLLMNKYVVGLTGQIVAHETTLGMPYTNTLTSLGQTYIDGEVSFKTKPAGRVSGTGAVYDINGKIIGSVMPATTFVNKSGVVLGKTAGNNLVVDKNGKTAAIQSTFGMAITEGNIWAGGALQSGVAVNDDAAVIGTISSDGIVLDKGDLIAGRVLSDGSVISVSDRELFNTMPYIGSTVYQGMPFSYRGKILGTTTLNGDVVDSSGQKTFRILDDGTILGKDEPLVGAILPFLPAISQKGDILGALAGNGKIISPTGETKGTIAVNETVKGAQFEILGLLIPQRTITNDCKFVGMSAYNGQVVDAKGTVVGRVRPDKWVVNSAGNTIGRVTRNGIVVAQNGDYLGRTMPDSTVVDPSGVTMGCARNDGSVVDNNGNIIGRVIERGLILGKDGKPLGRVKADGSIVNEKGEVIGKILADGTAVDLEGNVIGHMVSRDEEILYDDKGNIIGTMNSEGKVRDPKTGEVMFQVHPDGRVTDGNGNPIGEYEDGKFSSNGKELTDLTLLKDKNGNTIGIVDGCDVINSYGDKIGSILANGNVVDLNGEVFARILGNGTILDKDGNELGRVTGTNVRLDKCGIRTTDSMDDASATSETSGVAGRSIFIGNKKYTVSESGSIISPEGVIEGYMGDDGRPYTLDNRPLTASGDSTGRSRPNLAPKQVVTPEQIQQMKNLLTKKRESMKAGISERGKIMANAHVKAMSRQKKDKNWKDIGRSVSSWPVDMSRMILRDKAIPAVIVRSIDSRFTDVPVTAIVERHIYAEQGRNIIIPAGSRVIGKLSAENGNSRVAKMEITWERLIRPDGGAFSFQATSGDAQGRGGVAAYLDDQLINKYGKPIMTSVVTSAVSYMMAANDDYTTNASDGTTTQSSKSEAVSDARENFINAMDRIFQNLIDESTQVPNVVFVPSGTRVTIFSNEDLWLRSEDDDIEEYASSSDYMDMSQAQTPDTNSWIDKRTGNDDNE
ncbi:MAG: DUF3659 domain-containing protein, partial [Alphaproteobacteria bacterium]|nr:DUF3659 domain-containing protein [Alphaproteobacteria bacterium]